MPTTPMRSRRPGGARRLRRRALDVRGVQSVRGVLCAAQRRRSGGGGRVGGGIGDGKPSRVCSPCRPALVLLRSIRVPSPAGARNFAAANAAARGNVGDAFYFLVRFLAHAKAGQHGEVACCIERWQRWRRSRGEQCDTKHQQKPEHADFGRVPLYLCGSAHTRTSSSCVGRKSWLPTTTAGPHLLKVSRKNQKRFFLS